MKIPGPEQGTNCKPTIELVLPLLSNPSQNRSRVTQYALKLPTSLGHVCLRARQGGRTKPARVPVLMALQVHPSFMRLGQRNAFADGAAQQCIQ